MNVWDPLEILGDGGESGVAVHPRGEANQEGNEPACSAARGSSRSSPATVTAAPSPSRVALKGLGGTMTVPTTRRRCGGRLGLVEHDVHRPPDRRVRGLHRRSAQGDLVVGGGCRPR